MGLVIGLATGITVILAFVIGLFTNAWIALAVFIGILGAFFLQGLRQIPASPPHKGVPTFLGERQRRSLSEGWHVFPIFPYLYGVVSVNVERKNLDLVPENVRTPDRALISVPVSITYTPDEENLIAYLNSGGEEGVNNIIDDVVNEVVREWAMSRDRGPQTWEEALQVHGEALPIVVNALAGRDIDHVLDPGELALMRAGNGALTNTALGFVLNRANITEIQVLGEVAQAAERQAREKQERAGEKLELDHVRKRIRELTLSPPNGPGLTPETARRVVQVERGKITETVETKVFGVTPESFQGVGELFGRGGGDRQ